MYAMKNVWQDSVQIDFGINHNIQLSGFIFGMWTRNECDIVITNYPGMWMPEMGHICQDEQQKKFLDAATKVKFEGMSDKT